MAVSQSSQHGRSSSDNDENGNGGAHDGNTKPLPVCHVANSTIQYSCCQYAHCSECPLNESNQ